MKRIASPFYRQYVLCSKIKVKPINLFALLKFIGSRISRYPSAPLPHRQHTHKWNTIITLSQLIPHFLNRSVIISLSLALAHILISSLSTDPLSDCVRQKKINTFHSPYRFIKKYADQMDHRYFFLWGRRANYLSLLASLSFWFHIPTHKVPAIADIILCCIYDAYRRSYMCRCKF